MSANPKNVLSAHWTDGGTGLTNFDPEDLPIYQEAIRRHGSKNFFISNHPMLGFLKTSGMSLHRHETGDASDFWATFRECKKELEGNVVTCSALTVSAK